MVINSKSVGIKVSRRAVQPPPPPSALRRRDRAIVVRPNAPADRRAPAVDAAPDDVIDLGAPRHLHAELHLQRRPRVYAPNPRLYPGVPARERRSAGAGGARRRRELVFRRPVPNARLYRPAPPRARAPPPHPRTAWPPPAPRLDTASSAALRLAEQRAAPYSPVRSPPPKRAPPAQRRTPRHAARRARLVVMLPGASGNAGGSPPPVRYRPHSAHFRLRAAAGDADSGSSGPAAARPPGHDDADGHSAPSEFLAEFLSAIMQRQYAEALKYCRLILQYEPHNATARGFYPLLQHKLRRAPPPPPPAPRECASSGSETSVGSSESPSPEWSPRSLSPERSRGSPSAASESDSGARWPSSHSDLGDLDDNGNAPLAPRARATDENDNAAGAGESGLQSESAASLRLLRAQFACSIK